jgi:hypothetical protein
MSDPPAADDARHRADQAGARARELRERLDAAQAGGHMRGSSTEDVEAAERRATQATSRLRRALASSAAAHDRAADGHETAARLSGDPQGTHATQAADHRRAAAADRERADALPTETQQSQ